MPIIRISRRSEWANRIRKYVALVDEVEAGRVKNGQTLELEVPAGRGTIQMKIDWAYSEAIVWDLAEGETLDLVTGCNYTGWRLLLMSTSGLASTGVPGGFIYLRPAVAGEDDGR